MKFTNRRDKIQTFCKFFKKIFLKNIGPIARFLPLEIHQFGLRVCYFCFGGVGTPKVQNWTSFNGYVVSLYVAANGTKSDLGR